MNALIAEVGAESVATVQAPNLRTRAQRQAARIAQQMHPMHNLLAHCINNCLVCLTMGLIMCLRQILMVPLLVRRHAPAM